MMAARCLLRRGTHSRGFDFALGWFIFLTCLPKTCLGQFQILQDEGSDAPSDVPSTSPSGRNGAGSFVPTVETTFSPTSIPVCPEQWSEYRTCFDSGMSLEQSSACDSCIGSSFPSQDSSCEEYSTSICTALTETCDCGPCDDDIEVYFRCVYDELGLECPLDCGTIDEAPVAPPSSPVMVDEGPASSAPSPSPPQTDAPGAQTGAPSPPPAAPPGSTSGASRPETCHRFVPSVATRGFLVLTAALLL